MCSVVAEIGMSGAGGQQHVVAERVAIGQDDLAARWCDFGDVAEQSSAARAGCAAAARQYPARTDRRRPAAAT
ncbi:hypothetical protein BER93_00205 [Xanthomonas fragariae]|nr:hypothetical protein BER93_00205 [Xanthomonas fragariae]